MIHVRKDLESGLLDLLEKIYRERGWDFRDYKKASLTRRISKRLNALKAPTYLDYCRVLDSDPSEYNRLFSTITIKVSEFFREPEVFDFLKGAVRDCFSAATGLKAWCCGCAYGEEAYSLAILLSESLSHQAMRHTKVFATDIDQEALDQARRAVYREDSIRNVAPELRARHFTFSDGLYRVRHAVRNHVKFGTLDIVKNPSLSGVNLLFCRNVFIYFNKGLQRKVFEKLDYSLRPGGIIVLGKAEVMPSSFSSGYTQLGERLSIYRKNI